MKKHVMPIPAATGKVHTGQSPARCSATHNHIHTYAPRNARLWQCEETGVLGGNPRGQKDRAAERLARTQELLTMRQRR